MNVMRRISSRPYATSRTKSEFFYLKAALNDVDFIPLTGDEHHFPFMVRMIVTCFGLVNREGVQTQNAIGEVVGCFKRERLDMEIDT